MLLYTNYIFTYDVRQIRTKRIPNTFTPPMEYMTSAPLSLLGSRSQTIHLTSQLAL